MLDEFHQRADGGFDARGIRFQQVFLRVGERDGEEQFLQPGGGRRQGEGAFAGVAVGGAPVQVRDPADALADGARPRAESQVQRQTQGMDFLFHHHVHVPEMDAEMVTVARQVVERFHGRRGDGEITGP